MIVSSKEFTWSGNVGVTDMSDLGHVLQIEFNSKTTFTVKSEKTGMEKTFYFARYDRDGDGDITGLRFISSDMSAEILIIND